VRALSPNCAVDFEGTQVNSGYAQQEQTKHWFDYLYIIVYMILGYLDFLFCLLSIGAMHNAGYIPVMSVISSALNTNIFDAYARN